MIYLHHTPLSMILPNYHGRLSKHDRLMIYKYRHCLLSEFCQHLNLPVPIYDKDENGKPFCKNIANLFFNQSHNLDSYVLLYGLNIHHIGVDIETMSRNLNFDKLAKRYFHSDEYQTWQENSCDRKLWFQYWTIKEAVLKASGLGIRMPLKALKAVYMDKTCGYVDNPTIGKFYFQHIMVGDDMITLAYPFEFGGVEIVVV